MRILYHHRTAAKDGMDVHIRELVAAFERRGHVIEIVGPAEGDAREIGSSGSLVTTIRRNLPRAAAEGLEIAYDKVATRRLRAAATRFRPDIVYERYNLFLTAGLQVARAIGAPFIVEVNSPLAEERDVHGGLALKGIARTMEAKVWAGADLVLPVTSVLADMVAEQGVGREKLLVTPNGVRMDMFRPDQADRDGLRRKLGLEGKVVLGFTGFVRDWHGLDRVIRLLAEGQLPQDVHFLVVGDGPELPRLRTLATELGVTERVHFAGVVGRADIPTHVAAFDIALQPRVVPYASPLKLFEYMAMRRPIIAPDTPNIREILTHEADALLFAESDLAGFATAIYRLSTDHVLRSRLGQAARARIIDRDLTWDGNARRIEDTIYGRGLLQRD